LAAFAPLADAYCMVRTKEFVCPFLCLVGVLNANLSLLAAIVQPDDARACVCIYIFLLNAYTYVHICFYIHICIYIYTYIHIYAYVYAQDVATDPS